MKGARAHYRLRGEVGGAARSYAIRLGENSIGSRAGNAIVLPVRGVSRRHAVVTQDAEGLAVEDLGSRNGTLVKGVRVERTRLLPGDEMRLGPVTLRVDAVEPDDAAMGIEMRGGDAVPGLPAGDTTGTPFNDPARAILGLVEGLIARTGFPEPDLVRLITLLARGLDAESGCLFEAGRGEVTALAAYGAVPDLARFSVFRELLRAPEPPGGVRAVSIEWDPPLTCALLAGRGTERLGVVLTGPLSAPAHDAEGVLRVVLALVQRFHRLAAADPATGAEVPGLVFPRNYVPGNAPAMRAFHAQLQPLVRSDVPILLLGETGVGKEFLARIVHDSSARRGGPFVAINCAAIPADLLEAEMFGIGKGVATGVTERRGKFQMAEGGTLFLDEIGDMPVELQAKLLRALQEKEIQPVGGPPLAVDIRVIAATNSDLQRRMDEGKFRRDLYFRIAGFAVRVPPLRERREDVSALVESFLQLYSREAGRGPRGITVKALRALIDYSWPGNVRELQHEVRRLVHLCPAGDAIDAAMISDRVVAGIAGATEAAEADGLDIGSNVEALERRLIAEALARAGGNRTRAARLLGVSRNGLAIKIERLGIR